MRLSLTATDRKRPQPTATWWCRRAAVTDCDRPQPTANDRNRPQRGGAGVRLSLTANDPDTHVNPRTTTPSPTPTPHPPPPPKICYRTVGLSNLRIIEPPILDLEFYGTQNLQNIAPSAPYDCNHHCLAFMFTPISL